MPTDFGLGMRRLLRALQLLGGAIASAPRAETPQLGSFGKDGLGAGSPESVGVEQSFRTG